jgi:hypothetical protein
MIKYDDTTSSAKAPSRNECTALWVEVSSRFLDAVCDEQRAKVAELLHTVHNGGSGLRDWVSAIAFRGAVMPTKLPGELIDVYLSDSESMPLHDCEGCGLAMPVRPSHLYGLEGEPERVYFSACPACGSRTGPSMYFTRQFEENISDTLRRRPR